MIDLIGTLRWIKTRVDHIFALVNAMLTLQNTGGTISTVVLDNEYDLYRVDPPMGVFKFLKVQIDFTHQTAAETVVVKVYYRITGGLGLIQKDERQFVGVQFPLLKNIELEPNREGVQVTLTRIAGGTQDYHWAAFYEG